MNQPLYFSQLAASVSGAMVGNYAGHSLSEAYNNRNVVERKAETNSKYKTTTTRVKAAANDSVPAYVKKEQISKAARWNAKKAPTKAWDELQDQFATENGSLT